MPIPPTTTVSNEPVYVNTNEMSEKKQIKLIH